MYATTLRVRLITAACLVAGPLAVGAQPAAADDGDGFGDVTTAVRYDTSKPYGEVLADLEDEDDYTQTVASPFTLNFFGRAYNGLCITTNGGIYPVETDADSCADNYDLSVEEMALDSADPVIAALGADQDPSVNIDPTGGESPFADNDSDGYPDDGFGAVDAIYFDDSTTIDGKTAAIVTWYRVAMYEDSNDSTLYNTYQMVLIQEPTADPSNGYDFTAEFNYGTVQDGEDGYDVDTPDDECTSEDSTCRWGVGWSDYDPDTGTASAFEFFADVEVPDLLDGGALALTEHSLNSAVLGRYVIQMTGGTTVGFIPIAGAPPTAFGVTSLDLTWGDPEATYLEPDGSATCTVTDGTLPAGLTLNAGTCQVVGTPTVVGPYTFEVTATNSAGSFALTYAGTVAATAPGAPTNVVGTSGPAEVTVSWDAPASDGGAPITAYAVTASPGGATCTTTGATSCVVTGLTPGTDYSFTVLATNVVGDGQPSSASLAVAPTAVPTTAAPTTTTATTTTTTTAPTATVGSTTTIPATLPATGTGSSVAVWFALAAVVAGMALVAGTRRSITRR